MAGTIGYDSTSGQGGDDYTSSANHRILSGTLTYTAVANDEITDIGFHCGVYEGNGDGVEVGVYNISSGVDGATLVATTTIDPTLNSRNIASITPVSLVSGDEYAMSMRVVSSTNVTVFNAYVTAAGRLSSLTGTSALAASFTDNAGTSNRLSIFAIVGTAAGGGANPKGPFTHPLYGPFRGPIS